MSPLANSDSRYGSVSKTFHWLTALLILSQIPLGIIATNLGADIASGARAADQALVSRAALLFSLHKTLGVTVFFVALLRILWAIGQVRPGLLNGDKPAEAFAAHTVHWLLYGALIIMPLSGWVRHAAATGFAPIWWPFGQSLPFVPRDEGWAETASTIHYLMQWVLIAALGLHILGALKHHLLDKDATLRRMLPGGVSVAGSARQPGHTLPLVAALAVWGAVLGGAGAAGWFSHAGAGAQQPVTLAEGGGNWQVIEGTLGITVQQMGSGVSGRFSEWSADIQYAPDPDAAGKHGEVRVEISTASLSLGSVTTQATGPGYLASESFPIALFEADIISVDNALIAKGDLVIRDLTLPVEMPFTLALDGETATASGKLTVDRRAFEMGQDVRDASTLGFDVEIGFDLVATRRATE